jgi:hypothetical protein
MSPPVAPRLRTRAIGLLALAALSGCADIGSFSRPYAWTLTGSNAANLAVMAEVPADLAQGRGEPGADGVAAAAAVARLRADRVRPLPEAGGGTGGDAAGGAPGSASGAAAPAAAAAAAQD